MFVIGLVGCLQTLAPAPEGATARLLGDPAWTYAPAGEIFAATDAGDVDGDGARDLAFAVLSNVGQLEIHGFRGPVFGAAPDWILPVPGPREPSRVGLRSGDVNGDGFADVFIYEDGAARDEDGDGVGDHLGGRGADGALSWYPGGPTGWSHAPLWRIYGPDPGTGFGRYADVADRDDDGDLDMLVGAEDWVAPCSADTGPGAWPVADSSGIGDTGLGCGFWLGRAYLFDGDGGGGFSPPTFTVGRRDGIGHQLAFAQVDGDPSLEIVLPGPRRSWIFDDGEAPFDAARLDAPWYRLHVLGDTTGDGVDELAYNAFVAEIFSRLAVLTTWPDDVALGDSSI